VSVERLGPATTSRSWTRVEDLAPEAIARPLGEIRAACRVGRLARRIEGQSESGDACGLREPSSDAHAQPPGTLPNPALTPGAVRTTDRDDVCADRHTKQYRHWSRAQADRILEELEEYGLPPGPYSREHEIDHLISLDLGGADTDDNLWPEPRRSIEPVWNAERKDLAAFYGAPERARVANK
jgi:hypothetical protein